MGIYAFFLLLLKIQKKNKQDLCCNFVLSNYRKEAVYYSKRLFEKNSSSIFIFTVYMPHVPMLWGKVDLPKMLKNSKPLDKFLKHHPIQQILFILPILLFVWIYSCGINRPVLLSISLSATEEKRYVLLYKQIYWCNLFFTFAKNKILNT